MCCSEQGCTSSGWSRAWQEQDRQQKRKRPEAYKKRRGDTGGACGGEAPYGLVTGPLKLVFRCPAAAPAPARPSRHQSRHCLQQQGRLLLA